MVLLLMSIVESWSRQADWLLGQPDHQQFQHRWSTRSMSVYAPMGESRSLNFRCSKQHNLQTECSSSLSAGMTGRGREYPLCVLCPGSTASRSCFCRATIVVSWLVRNTEGWVDLCICFVSLLTVCWSDKKVMRKRSTTTNHQCRAKIQLLMVDL